MQKDSHVVRHDSQPASGARRLALAGESQFRLHDESGAIAPQKQGPTAFVEELNQELKRRCFTIETQLAKMITRVRASMDSAPQV